MAQCPNEEIPSYVKRTLESLGKVKFVGTIKQAHSLKSSLLSVILLSLPVVSHAVEIGTKSGVDPDMLVEMFRDSAIFPNYVSDFAERMIKKQYDENIGNDIVGLAKDIDVFKSLSKSLGIDHSLFNHLQGLVNRAQSDGYSHKDFTVIHEVSEKKL